MRDPIEQLENLTPGAPMHPLPAAEVRRLGDRRRRRTTALTTVAAAAAIAVVAVPVAALARHDSPSTPEPAAPTWVQRIPEGFPLTDGLPVPVKVSTAYEARVDGVCTDAAWSADGTVDTRQAVHTDQSEGGADRTLALYPSDRQAESALADLIAQVDTCAARTAGGYPRAEVVTSGQGDQSLVYANRYTDGGDLAVVELVRVGNAILQSTGYSTGAAPEDTADGVAEKAAPVVAAMCVFSGTGCGDTAVDEGADQVIPDDFPLSEGLPSTGTTGPSRDLAPIALEACGATAEVPEHTDLVRAGSHAPGDDRERQLVTFADEQQAQAYLRSVIRLYEDCPETTVDGTTQLVQAIGSISGYDAAGGAHIRSERDGRPVPGIETVAVVRVGNAVLLSTISTDDTAGPDGGKIQDQTQTAFDSIDGVVAAMRDLG